MTDLFFLPFVAGSVSLLLALVSVLRTKRSTATWCFFVGMIALGVDSIFMGFSLRAIPLEGMVYWLTAAVLVKCLVPAIWLGFSLTYSRGHYRESLRRWTIPLASVGLLPLGLALGFHDHLFAILPPGTAGDIWRVQFGAMAKALNAVLLVALLLILMNLEQTFRAAIGTMRWRIKFVVLAVAVIVGARLYIRSQAILFSAPDIAFWSLESGSLLVGCLFLVLAYGRAGMTDVDVYPSASVLRSSLTVVIVGGYLLIVGVLAQLVSRFGGAEIFKFQAVVVLVGMAGLAVLLLSDRARHRIQAFVARHFSKSQHDSVRVWTLFSQRLASVRDQAGLSAMSGKLVSETFDVLSVTVWLVDEERRRLAVGASTARQASASDASAANIASQDVIEGLAPRSSPFDLEDVAEPWASEFRQLNASVFAHGGHRLCVPLRSGDRSMGVLVLADRVSGAIYSVEELELLKCIGDQITSVLLNLRLANEVAQAKELDAFRTMSAFFVHDLKNAASSLNLMLKNLPVHFDDPAFRADALRGIGNTAGRIDDMIGRLSALRQRTDSLRVQADLNQLVNEALDRVNGTSSVDVVRELQPLPMILVDREQIQSVVTNLVLNARDALGSGGRIHVRTDHRNGSVVLSVVDNGCGMSQAFVNDSLFRPFQSTKKKGLGIGLFQSRMIVQAHQGRMQVETELGKGTTFLVSFPAGDRT